MIANAKITDYRKTSNLKAYNLSVNAFWITISDEDGNVLFDRNPNKPGWLDPMHDRITDALQDLESAVIEAANSPANSKT